MKFIKSTLCPILGLVVVGLVRFEEVGVHGSPLPRPRPCSPRPRAAIPSSASRPAAAAPPAGGSSPAAQRMAPRWGLEQRVECVLRGRAGRRRPGFRERRMPVAVLFAESGRDGVAGRQEGDGEDRVREGRSRCAQST